MRAGRASVMLGGKAAAAAWAGCRWQKGQERQLLLGGREAGRHVRGEEAGCLSGRGVMEGPTRHIFVVLPCLKVGQRGGAAGGVGHDLWGRRSGGGALA